MIINTISTSGCQPQTIVIGRRGTYDTMQIAFDLSYLVESFGNGVAVLAVKRSQDESAYPAVTSQEDDLLLWTVSETDTYYVGAGECQLMWYVDGGLAKTIIYPMVVMRDILATSEDAPDAYPNWIESLTALGAETLKNAQNAAQSASDAEDAKDDAVAAKEAAEAAQEAAETAVAHYPTIQNNYWMVWDSTSQSYVSTGIQAEGEDGYSPEVTITSIEGGHRVTITDKDHPQGQSFDVMDGQGGGGTSDYTDLTNKPSINNVTLTGNKTAADLGLATPSDIPTDAGDIEFDDQETYAAGSIGAEVSQQKNAIEQKAPVIINTASGDVASFADGADGMQIRKVVGTIVTPEGGSGCTGATLTNTSENLIPIAEGTPDKIIAASGYMQNLDGWWSSYFFPLAPGDYIVTSEQQSDMVLALFPTNISFDGMSRTYLHGSNLPHSFTVTSDKPYCRVSVQKYKSISNPGAVVSKFVNTIPINWQTEAGTILNGTVTLNDNGSADVTNSDSGRSYHLTDVGTIATYLGLNNISINTGEIIECVYSADTNLYINELVIHDEEVSNEIANPFVRKVLKSENESIDGFSHCAFPSVALFNDSEIVAYRASKSHYTPTSPDNWGGVMLDVKKPDGNWIHVGLLETNGYSFNGELRDPKLTVSRDGKTLFLSCFTTWRKETAPNVDVYDNVIFTLDGNLEITSMYHETEASHVLWGNVITTPDGYLLISEYTNGEVIVKKSLSQFFGTLSNNTFDNNNVAVFTASNLSECCMGYWNNKYLMIVMRRGSYQCRVSYTENLEGDSGWVVNNTINTNIGDPIFHAPMLLPAWFGEYLPVMTARFYSEGDRHTEIALMMENNGVFTWVDAANIDKEISRYSGYCGFTYLGGDEFATAYYLESSSGFSTLGAQTGLFYKHYNLRRMIPSTAYLNI